MSENTCNALLAEELRKKGLNAFFEKHFTTLGGIKKPDIFIDNDGYYFIEGKQRPSQLIHAVSKAHVYREATKTTVSPKAVFGVLYPIDCTGICQTGVLMDEAPYYIEFKSNSLAELASWIADFINVPTKPSEINTNHVINLLNGAVKSITSCLGTIGLSEIEEIFGGKSFFESILGYEEEKNIPLSHLQLGASYLLVNQILFYQILAKETKAFQPLTGMSIGHPADLQRTYFSRILEIDYKPIFDFDVASKLHSPYALEAVRTTINAVNALSPEKIGHDILGKIFHNLIPLDIRKVVAAYFTNSEAADILTSLAIDDPNWSVMDPACGSGTLLVSSYRRKKELLEKLRPFTEIDHKRFIQHEITGIDIMPFAAHLAAVHMALQAPLYFTDKIRIAIHDSTKLSPDSVINSAHESFKEAFKDAKMSDYFEGVFEYKKRKAISGAVSLSQSEVEPIRLDHVDLIIMNPPFTRFQRIPLSYKKTLEVKLSHRYGKYLHGQLGLHGYFMLLADKFIKKGGRVAAVLPITTLTAKGFSPILNLLLNVYTLEYVITSEGRAAFSENASVREILLIARKQNPVRSKVAIVALKQSPRNMTLEDAHRIGVELRGLESGKKHHILEDYKVRYIDQDFLRAHVRHLLKSVMIFEDEMIHLDEIIISYLEGSSKICTLKSYLHKIHGDLHESKRGLEKYGYYSLAIINGEHRALKNHDVWVVQKKSSRYVEVKHRFVHKSFRIERSSLLPNIRRYASLQRIDISNDHDFVVAKPFKSVNEYLSTSDPTRKLKISELLVSGKWEKFVNSQRSNLTLIYRTDLAAPGTHHLAFYSKEPVFVGGSFWRAVINDQGDAKILALWFNSTLNLFQLISERKETRGSWVWYDKYVLEQIYTIDSTELTISERTKLLKLYDEISEVEFPSIAEQLESKYPLRRKIDKAFLTLLGFGSNDANKFLDRLYEALSRQLKGLVKVMNDN